jgi:hypothetical protein
MHSQESAVAGASKIHGKADSSPALCSGSESRKKKSPLDRDLNTLALDCKKFVYPALTCWATVMPHLRRWFVAAFATFAVKTCAATDKWEWEEIEKTGPNPAIA